MNEIFHYDCPNCGAQVDVPQEIGSTNCAFCDSPVVVNNFVSTQSIDILIPFLLSKKQASRRLAKFLASRFLTPKALKKKAPDMLKGVLTPFWVCQAEARSHYSADIGIHWYETVTYTTTENGQTVTKTRQELRTDWHSLQGTHVQEYTDHLVCSSVGLTEEETNRIEPFDLGKALRFSPELLAGWLSEIPTRTVEEMQHVARQEIQSNEGTAIAAFLPGDVSKNIHHQTEVNISNVQFALLPIWIATYKYKGEVLRLLVNGQTGAVNGQLPTDHAKIAFIVVFVLTAIGLLFWFGGRI